MWKSGRWRTNGCSRVHAYQAISPRRTLWAHVSIAEGSGSVPANIAEGFGKRGKLDKLRFYNIAQGSLNECRYYLILSHDLGLGDSNDLLAQQSRICKMLHAYSHALMTAPPLSTNY